MLIAFIIIYIIAAVFTYIFSRSVIYQDSKVLSIIAAIFWPIVYILVIIDAYNEDGELKK